MDNTEENIYIHEWEKNKFKWKDESSSKYDRADSLRHFLAQYDYLRNSDMSHSRNDFYDEIADHLKKYGSLVDNSKVGLNNYAEPILSLVENLPNDSQHWTCDINVDEILKKHGNKFQTENDELNAEYEKLAIKISKEKPKTADEIIKEFKKTIGDLDEKQKSSVANVHKPPSIQQTLTKPDNPVPQINNKPFQKQVPSCSYSNQNENVHLYQNHQDQIERKPTEQVSPPASNFSFGKRGGKYPWNKLQTKRQRNFTETSCPTPAENRQQNYSVNRQIKASDNKQNNADMDTFRTASHQYAINQLKKKGSLSRESYSNSGYSMDNQNRNYADETPATLDSYGISRKCLGNKKTVNSKFVPPVRRDENEMPQGRSRSGGRGSNDDSNYPNEDSPYAELLMDERLKNIEPKMVELIMNEIMDNGTTVTWNDIAGLELAKSTIQEIVVWPMLRPDIFRGLRGPPKGILLFGPPGTGKTMIGKCIASQSKSTFFSISASSLTSKWIGEGEKMVRALFAVARCHQPAVIFMDEIDSLLTQRSESEHESSRRIKTEFLVQLDGATTGSEDRLLVIGATNRPQELDEAARRRLVKRLYIPLPDVKARQQIIENLMTSQSHSLSPEEIHEVSELTDGYSGADMANLCREAALGPIRSIDFNDIQHISADEVRPISSEDMKNALKSIRASVSNQDLDMYMEWNNKFGIYGR